MQLHNGQTVYTLVWTGRKSVIEKAKQTVYKVLSYKVTVETNYMHLSLSSF